MVIEPIQTGRVGSPPISEWSALSPLLSFMGLVLAGGFYAAHLFLDHQTPLPWILPGNGYSNGWHRIQDACFTIVELERPDWQSVSLLAAHALFLAGTGAAPARSWRVVTAAGLAAFFAALAWAMCWLLPPYVAPLCLPLAAFTMLAVGLADIGVGLWKPTHRQRAE